jgi:nicotinamide-nucleotide amidase
VLAQALVLEGAEVIAPSTGTAAGQVVATPAGTLALLPGPPHEMRPMLTTMLHRLAPQSAEARELGVAGWPESDVQHAVQDILESFSNIRLTLLAKPGDVRVILVDEGAGEESLNRAADAVAHAIGSACYATDGSTLAETVVREAAEHGMTLAVAESCTGGTIAAALTDVPGSSRVFLGGVVTYSNDSKTRLLGIDPNSIAEHGAVSRPIAEAMARGTREQFGADVCVAITGIAGPSGAARDKPVGTVWFGLRSDARNGGHFEELKTWTGTSREIVRTRATSFALDLLRREVAGT